jgi:hypothetical protein
MAVTIKIPTGLTFRKTTIDVPGIGLVAGDDNPFWDQLVELGIAGQVIRASNDYDLASYGPIRNTRWITIQNVIPVIAAGGEFEGLTVFFVVPEASYQDDVPVGFFNSTITELVDEEEVTRQRTWEEWKSPNHTHELIEGNYYIPSTSWGVHMTAKQWFPFTISGQVTAVLEKPTE